MRIPFRHGLVRYQTDNANPNPNPTFLQPVNGGSFITLVVSPDPTILTFSHGDSDYLFEERVTVHKAWGEFESGKDYWLYWDIDLKTGERTFGSTELEPIVAPTAPSGLDDQHWYDKRSNSMKVFHRGRFVERLRVFAAKYSAGTVLEHYNLGTQVVNNTTCYAGTILFNDVGKPIHHVNGKRKSRFVTTESNFTTHASDSTSIRLEADVEFISAVDNIAAFQLVSYHGTDQVGHASNTDTVRTIIGMIREDLFVGEIGTFISTGYVRNPNWNWAEDAGTRLFCDGTGQVTTQIPQSGSLQEVGKIVSPTTILLDIKPMIVLE